MMTGTMFFITSVGCIMPMLAMPTPDLAVPYAAPRLAKTSALATPMKPKKAAAGWRVAGGGGAGGGEGWLRASARKGRGS